MVLIIKKIRHVGFLKKYPTFEYPACMLVG